MFFKSQIIRAKSIDNLKVKHGCIVVGDVHLYNAHPYSNREELISSRLRDLSQVLFVIGSTAKTLDLPLIINGDLIHANILDYPVLKVLADFFEKFKDVDITINVGNHDLDGKVSVLSPLMQINKSDKHSTIEYPFVYKNNKTSLCFVPFMKESLASKHIERISKDLNPDDTNILFFHGTFSGSSWSAFKKSKSGISQKAFYLKKFDLIVASHIHKYQKLCNGRGFYTSSMIPLNFGEQNLEHGFHIIDFDKRRRYFVIPKVPRFIEINLSDMKTMQKVELERMVKGNIICIRTDILEPFNKKKIKDELMEMKAMFILFKNIPATFDKTEQPKIKKEGRKVESIVTGFSKILADKYDLKQDNVERHGLDILQKAKKEISRKKVGGRINGT
jgi:DNA repair exonuclease SbcCD nuclease subunit